MAAQNYVVFYPDVTGSPLTGLTPTITSFCKVSDGSTISAPIVTEISASHGPGHYKFSYDPAVPAVGIIDAGSDAAIPRKAPIAILA